MNDLDAFDNLLKGNFFIYKQFFLISDSGKLQSTIRWQNLDSSKYEPVYLPFYANIPCQSKYKK